MNRFNAFAFVAFAVPCVATALLTPERYNFLTYWTLLLHLASFASRTAAFSATPSRILHSASFVGAFAVLAGYALVSVGGVVGFGSWYSWETAVSKSSNTFFAVLVRSIYEHVWPCVAVVIETWLNADALRRCYVGCRLGSSLAVGLATYFGFGIIWQTTCASSSENAMTIYLQPDVFSTSSILGHVGIDAAGLEEDFVFVKVQQILMLSTAACMFVYVIGPFIVAQTKVE
mmetsp:Transcript_56631/g.93610  ORF Transcript_56631/g.93610 Transcript_56631/m.93610 type:complete len:231 (-) Transcript_56631:281-973(-)